MAARFAAASTRGGEPAGAGKQGPDASQERGVGLQAVPHALNDGLDQIHACLDDAGRQRVRAALDEEGRSAEAAVTGTVTGLLPARPPLPHTVAMMVLGFNISWLEAAIAVV